jgi:hypothetical protein
MWTFHQNLKVVQSVAEIYKDEKVNTKESKSST